MTNILQKREYLKELSANVKDLVAEQRYKSINHALIIEQYKKDGHTTFKTLADWNKDGFKVKEGSKAFLLWGKPQEKRGDEGRYTFFPVLFIFSNKQVIKQERRRQYGY